MIFLLTMQYNEDIHLSIFLRHYSRFFKPENIYVIDHGSIKNNVPNEYNRIYVPRHKPFSETDRLSLIKGICHGLLPYYDYGVYADCDELINLQGVDSSIFQKQI